MKQSYREIRIQRDLAWQELRDIRAAISADPQESTLDEVRRLMAKQDTAFATERAAAFNAHCYAGHNADFEVCTDPRCRAVVVEEARRGLLDPGDAWPPIEPDDKPNYTEEL